jgi:hypothetical protein
MVELKSAAIFSSGNPLHPPAGLTPAVATFYVVIKLGKRTAAKLVKGTAESPNMDAAGIPKML